MCDMGDEGKIDSYLWKVMCSSECVFRRTHTDGTDAINREQVCEMQEG